MSDDLTEKVAYAIFREHCPIDDPPVPAEFSGTPREVSLKAARAVLALLDDLKTCDHPDAIGIDSADADDPYKVWECNKCGDRFTEAAKPVKDWTESETAVAAFKAEARAARELQTELDEAEAKALRAAAEEFATGDRVMERCTRGLVAAWLRDRAHLIEAGEQS